FTPQFSPVLQVAPQGPPQSTSVSSWSCSPSEHVAAHLPATQLPPAQSALTVQTWLKPHFGQEPPPQSTSVSVPFFTLSEQLGAWHVPPKPPPEQIPLEQSEFAMHAP